MLEQAIREDRGTKEDPKDSDLQPTNVHAYPAWWFPTDAPAIYQIENPTDNLSKLGSKIDHELAR